MYHTQKRQLNLGRIETITGSMFSGKTEELILRLRKAQIARKRIQTFKPTTDTRYSNRHIVSHNNTKIEADVVTKAEAPQKYRSDWNRRRSIFQRGPNSHLH